MKKKTGSLVLLHKKIRVTELVVQPWGKNRGRVYPQVSVQKEESFPGKIKESLMKIGRIFKKGGKA